MEQKTSHKKTENNEQKWLQKYMLQVWSWTAKKIILLESQLLD